MMFHGIRPDRLLLMIAVLALNAFVFLVVTYSLREARTLQEQEVRATLENVSMLLDQSITDEVNNVDISLLNIADELERELVPHGRLPPHPTLNQFLDKRRSWISDLADFRITDASGDVKFGSDLEPGSHVSFADREFFIAHRARPDNGLIITNPILGRLSKKWVVSFTRRYNFPDGRFAGVIAASIPVSHLAHLLSGLDLGPHGVALLRDADTGLIARHPAVEDPAQQLGTKVFSKELAAIIVSGEKASTYHSVQTGDGEERINTYRRLSAVPFHLVVGMGAKDYLEAWRGQIRKAVIVCVIFLLASSILALMLWRMVNLHEKSSRSYRLLLQNAGDGIHILDERGQIVEASTSFFRMLGYERDEIIGMNIRQLDPNNSFPGFGKQLAEPLAQATPTIFETRHQCKGGHILEVEVTSSPLNLDGRTVLFCSSRDITARKAADDQIRKLSLAIEQSPNSILITNINAEIDYVNDAFETITGYAREEVIGKNPRFLQSGKTTADTYQAMWSALSMGLPWKGDFHNQRKDGTQYTETASIAPLRQPDGSISHYVAVKEDITEQLRLRDNLANYQRNLEELVKEKTLALSEEKALLQNLVDTIPFGVYRLRNQISPPDATVTPTFPTHEVDMVSIKCCELLGINPTEARSFLSSTISRIHADDQAEFVRLNNKATAERKPFAWEGRMNINGQEKWMRLDSTPRVGEAEIIWSGILQDITDRKRQSSLIYRSVVEASPDAFVAIDERERILEWSPQAERLFGFKFDEVKGKPLMQTIISRTGTSDPEEHRDDLLATERDGRIGQRRRLTAIRRDGSEFPIELRIMSLQIDNHWRYTSFIRDVTEDINAEQQLAQAQKLEAIGHLTSGLAHDFNNILGIVIGNLDLLSQELPTGEMIEMLDAAMAAAKRGADVTKSLLAVARRSPLLPREVDVNQLLLELEPLLAQTIGKRINMTLTAHAEHAYALLDASGFNNALLNLVLNARDAMPDGGDLMVYCYSIMAEHRNIELPNLAPGAYIVVGVDDTGIGMTPEIARQAFDPFFTTKGRHKGTGLGLSMVLGFARQSGGTARIVSNPGLGSSVEMILPATAGANHAARSETSQKARQSGLTTGSGLVLVVDDEAALLAIVARWLRDLGYEVETANAAQAARALLEQKHFDLLLTDIVMPGEMDGLALAHHAARVYPAMSILLASGYPENLSDEDRARWRLLQKPMNQLTLSEAVATTLGRHLPQEKQK